MSDDDLWRSPEPTTGEPSPGESARSGDRPTEQVSDETQPLTGAAPPGPGSGREPPLGAVPPPVNPFAQPPQPNPYGGPGYAPPPNPYPPPHEYAAPQNPYGAPYHPAYAGGGAPDHPSATTAMVLGIVSLVGIAFCGGITLVLAPAAWVVGTKAVRQIDAFPGQFGGRDRAQAGRIMGIVGSVLLVLGIVAVIAFVAVVVSVGNSDPQPSFPSPTFGNGGA